MENRIDSLLSLLGKTIVFYLSQRFFDCRSFFLNPFPNDKILDWSKLKEFADNNFEFDENGVTFSERVENTVGKGEIAPNEQFLLFPQSFQKPCTADT